MSRIENFQESWRFDNATEDYLRSIYSLEAGGKGTPVIYLMVVFDPVTPKAGRFSIAPFSNRSRSINADIFISSKETQGCDQEQIISDLGVYLVSVLEVIGARLPAARHTDIAAIQQKINETTRQYVPNADVKPRAFPEEQSEPAPTTTRLILQLPEAAFETFDDIPMMEAALTLCIDGQGTVDGHDIGMGTVNFFMDCAPADLPVDSIKELVAKSKYSSAKLYSETESRRRKLLWSF